MRTVKIHVSPLEMEKAVKGEEFTGFPQGHLVAFFEMHVEFSDIVRMSYNTTSSSPNGVICKISKRETLNGRLEDIGKDENGNYRRSEPSKPPKENRPKGFIDDGKIHFGGTPTYPGL